MILTMNWYNKAQKIDFLKKAGFEGKTQVDSDVISQFSYDKTKKKLKIEFRRGGMYIYANVPLSVFKGLATAKSKGHYFNKSIKDKYQVIQ